MIDIIEDAEKHLSIADKANEHNINSHMLDIMHSICRNMGEVYAHQISKDIGRQLQSEKIKSLITKKLIKRISLGKGKPTIYKLTGFGYETLKYIHNK